MKTKKRPRDEHPLMLNAIQYLTLRGHYVWRNNTGAISIPVKGGKARFIRFGKVGSSDILGIHGKTGQFIGIEVKDYGNKPSDEQIKFLKEINDRGGIGLCIYSLDDIMIPAL